MRIMLFYTWCDHQGAVDAASPRTRPPPIGSVWWWSSAWWPPHRQDEPWPGCAAPDRLSRLSPFPSPRVHARISHARLSGFESLVHPREERPQTFNLFNINKWWQQLKSTVIYPFVRPMNAANRLFYVIRINAGRYTSRFIYNKVIGLCLLYVYLCHFNNQSLQMVPPYTSSHLRGLQRFMLIPNGNQNSYLSFISASLSHSSSMSTDLCSCWASLRASSRRFAFMLLRRFTRSHSDVSSVNCWRMTVASATDAFSWRSLPVRFTCSSCTERPCKQ